MAKLTRESKLREKRMEKAARKAARKLEAENPTPEAFDDPYADFRPTAPTDAESPLGAAAEPAPATAEPAHDA